ncbi:hypothetical protein ACFOWE_33185 [Planomonospora corallina]|uniref:Uncharacterized protein n=1 Tax=Planomonospora corallina TaxID=1806052 RepID=A0ABV8IJB6_9ACTN
MPATLRGALEASAAAVRVVPLDVDGHRVRVVVTPIGRPDAGREAAVWDDLVAAVTACTAPGVRLRPAAAEISVIEITDRSVLVLNALLGRAATRTALRALRKGTFQYPSPVGAGAGARLRPTRATVAVAAVTALVGALAAYSGASSSSGSPSGAGPAPGAVLAPASSGPAALPLPGASGPAASGPVTPAPPSATAAASAPPSPGTVSRERRPMILATAPAAPAHALRPAAPKASPEEADRPRPSASAPRRTSSSTRSAASPSRRTGPPVHEETSAPRPVSGADRGPVREREPVREHERGPDAPPRPTLAPPPPPSQSAPPRPPAPAPAPPPEAPEPTRNCRVQAGVKIALLGVGLCL